MHVPGSRLGEYHTRWTFYWLSPHEFSGGLNKIKVKKNEEMSPCFHHDMHIYRFSYDKAHILKFRTLAFFHKRNF